MKNVKRQKILTIFLVLLFSSALVWSQGTQDVTEEETEEIVWMVLSDWPTEEFLSEFNKDHPDIKVVVEKFGFNELMQQIQIRMGAKSDAMDVISVDGPLVASYAYRNWLEPLDGVFSKDEMNNWLDSSLKAGIYNDTLYAAPQSTSTQLLYYNKDMFEENGITPPGENERWTWEQIRDAAVKLTKDINNDGNPDVWGFLPEQISRIYQLQAMPMSLGGKAIGDDGLTVEGVINSPEWIEAFDFYWKLFNEWEVGPKGEVIWPPDIFETENLAMFVGGPWDINRFAQADLPFEWGVSRHPYFSKGEVVTPTGGWHRGINVFSKQKEAAKVFVKWSTAGRGAELWWRIGNGDMPAQQSVLNLFETNEEFDTPPLSFQRVAAKEAAVNPQPRPITVGFLEYEQILYDTFQDIRNGIKAKEALDSAAERIEQEMDKYR